MRNQRSPEKGGNQRLPYMDDYRSNNQNYNNSDFSDENEEQKGYQGHRNPRPQTSNQDSFYRQRGYGNRRFQEQINGNFMNGDEQEEDRWRDYRQPDWFDNNSIRSNNMRREGSRGGFGMRRDQSDSDFNDRDRGIYHQGSEFGRSVGQYGSRNNQDFERDDQQYAMNEMLQKMAGYLNRLGGRNDYGVPQKYMSSFNLHSRRFLQGWELEVMFPPLMVGQGNKFVEAHGFNVEKGIPVSSLMEKLNERLRDFFIKAEGNFSIYKTKCDSDRCQYEVQFLKVVIRELKTQIKLIEKNSSIYRDAFRKETGNEKNAMQFNVFQRWVQKIIKNDPKYAAQLQSDRFIEQLFAFFLPEPQAEELNSINFVQALSEIVPDTQHRTTEFNNSFREQGESFMNSISRRTKNKTFFKVQADPTLKMACQSLRAKLNVDDFAMIEVEVKKKFKSLEKGKVLKNGAYEDVEDTALVSELQTFLRDFEVPADKIEAYVSKLKPTITLAEYDKVLKGKEKPLSPIKEKEDEKGEDVDLSRNESDSLAKDESETNKLAQQMDADNLSDIRSARGNMSVDESRQDLKKVIEEEEQKVENQRSAQKHDENQVIKESPEQPSSLPSINTRTSKPPKTEWTPDKKESVSQQPDGPVDIKPPLDKPIQEGAEKIEEYEGGDKETQRFDLKQFLNDLKTAWQDREMDPAQVEKKVNELFDVIKRWKITTGNSLNVMFQRYSPGTPYLSEDALLKFILRIMDPRKLNATDIKVYKDAFHLAFDIDNEKQLVQGAPKKILPYNLIIEQFFEYANKNAFEENPDFYLQLGFTQEERNQLYDDAIVEIKKILENSEKVMTLTSLLAVPPQQMNKLDNQGRHQALTLSFEAIFTQIKSHIGRSNQTHITAKNPLVVKFEQCKDLFKKLLTRNANPEIERQQVDLIYMQDIIGYKFEDAITVSDSEKHFRNLILQMKLHDVSSHKLVKEVEPRTGTSCNKHEFKSGIKKMKNVYRMDIPDKDMELIANQCLDKKMPGYVDVKFFRQMLEFEQNKFMCLLRFYIALEGERISNKKKDIEEVLFLHGFVQDQIEVEEFKKFLIKLEIIEELDPDSNNYESDRLVSNFRYLENEYFPNEVELDKKDILKGYEEFITSGQNSSSDSIIQKLQSSIFQKCDRFFNGDLWKFVQEILLEKPYFRLQQNEVKVRKANWLHAYDFTLKYIESYKKLVDYPETGDESELVNLWIKFLCVSQQTKIFKDYGSTRKTSDVLIYIPYFFQQYEQYASKSQQRVNRYAHTQETQKLETERYRTKLVHHVAHYMLTRGLELHKFYGQNQQRLSYEDLIYIFERQLKLHELKLHEEIEGEDGDIYWYDSKKVENCLLMDQGQRSQTHGYRQDIRYIEDLKRNFQSRMIEQEINDEMRRIETRERIFKDLAKHLEKACITIKEAISIVKFDSNGNEDSGFSEQDFTQIGLVFQFEITQNEIVDILDTMERDAFGEIPVAVFIKEFEQQLHPQTGAAVLLPSDKKRFEVLADLIEERQLKDIGSFFKGYDFNKDNLLETKTAFQILQKLTFDSQLGDGDILSILYSVEESRGFCNIQELADRLNRLIKDPTCMVKLESQLDNVVYADIVDPIEEREADITFADDTHVPAAIDKPDCLDKMILDLFCGLEVLATGRNPELRQLAKLSVLLGDYTASPGLIRMEQFIKAMNFIQVEGDDFDKQAVFEYFEKQMRRPGHEDEYSDKEVSISDLEQRISRFLPHHTKSDLEKEVLLRLARHLSDSKIPLHENIENFLREDVRSDQFRNDALSTIRARNELTENMIAVLEMRYNPRGERFFVAIQLIDDLMDRAHQTGLKIFKNQREIDEFYRMQVQRELDASSKVQTVRKVPPKEEPLYVCRTPRNTYWDPNVDRQTLGYRRQITHFPLTAQKWNGRFKELVLKTRQRGFTIEGFFQLFGTFSTKDGLRKLSFEQFIKALSAIKDLSWNKNEQLITQLFEDLDADNGQNYSTFNDEEYEKDQISLETIAKAVYFNTSVDLKQFESDVLQELHKALFETKSADKLLELFLFENFNRDCVCSFDQMLNFFFVQFRLQDKGLSQSDITIFLHRYAQQVPKPESKSPASGPIVTDLTKQQQVQFYTLLKDLGYCHRGFGLMDQQWTEVAEDIIRNFQYSVVMSGHEPYSEQRICDGLETFFRNHISGSVLITQSQFETACYQLGMNNSVHNSQRLEDFYAVCSLPEMREASKFVPNSIRLYEGDRVTAIDFQDFMHALMFLGGKPLSILYQDILDTFYIASKQLNLSIFGPFFIKLFADIDPNHIGQVRQDEFIERLEKFVTMSIQRVKQGVKKPVRIFRQDIEFLSTKYAQPVSDQNDLRYVSYVRFIEDYEDIETMGICAGKNELSLSDKVQTREISLRMKAAVTKKLSDLPMESRSIYEKMAKFILKKHMNDQVVLQFVQADQKKSGHLSAAQIKHVLSKCKMPVNQKQVDMLTKCIEAPGEDKFNYIQMISLLFGELVAQKTKADYQIDFDLAFQPDQPKPQQFNINLLQLRPKLKDEIELKLLQIGQLAGRHPEELPNTELFRILQQTNITVSQEDLKTLQQYAKSTKNEQEQIDFTHFCKHFGISPEPSALLANICQQLKQTSQDIQSLTVKQYLTFVDFQALLTTARVKVAEKQKSQLTRLFYMISEGKEEISVQTLRRLLEISLNEVKKVYRDDIPDVPLYVSQFVHHILDKKINLKEVFRQQLAAKLVNTKQFWKLLRDTEFEPASETTKVVMFFQDSKDQTSVNLSKIVTYIRKVDPSYLKSSETGTLKQLVEQNKNLPGLIKETLTLITEWTRENHISKEKLFDMMDDNGDGKVDENEMVEFFTKVKCVQGVTAAKVRYLHKFLDSDQSGTVSINELAMLLQGQELTFQEQMDSFSPQFEQQLKREIIDVFNMIDSDNDGYLTAHEIAKLLQPNLVDSNFNMMKAHELLSQFDSNQDGRVSKEEFVAIMLDLQKKKLLQMEGQMEDIRNSFREIACGEDDPLHKDCFYQLATGWTQLSKRGLRRLLTEKLGMAHLSNQELETIFNDMDTNKNGRINIDEFMKYLYSTGMNKDDKQAEAIFRIRKAHAKLNVKDIQMMFDAMPISFKPSFSQVELESRNKNTPCSNLLPGFDFESLTFCDFAKVHHYLTSSQSAFIGQFSPATCFEVNLTGMAMNVPLVRKLTNREECPHMELRCVLFNTITKSYLSPFYIQNLAPVVDPELERKMDKQTSASCRYDEALKKFVVTTDFVNSVELIFEFVAYQVNNFSSQKNEADRVSQVTVAWTSLPLTQVSTASSHKLALKGGTPFVEEPLAEEMQDQTTQKGGFFSKFMKPKELGNKDRCLTLEVTEFKQFASIQKKAEICLLPVPTIVSSNLVSFAAAFLTLSYKHLKNCSSTMKLPQPDLVISKFADIYNNCDTLSVIAQCWPTLIAAATDQESSEAQLKKVISTIYPLMWEPWYRHQRSRPLRTLASGSLVHKTKQLKIKTALMAEHKETAAILLKEAASIKPVSLMRTNYIPFNAAELNAPIISINEEQYDLFFDQAIA